MKNLETVQNKLCNFVIILYFLNNLIILIYKTLIYINVIFESQIDMTINFIHINSYS